MPANPHLGPNAQAAADTLAMKPAMGIPHTCIHMMEIGELEHFSGHQPGDYLRDPTRIYLAFQQAIHTSFIDQWIPENPKVMTAAGYESHHQRTATEGAEDVVLDGLRIDSPEAVVEHMERFVFPWLRQSAADCKVDDPAWLDAAAMEWVRKEQDIQALFGPDMLKAPYDRFGQFPGLRYFSYGYANYFMAYALYPGVMEQDFSLQADLHERKNRIAVRAYDLGNLPRIKRLDHDMADSRGALVRIDSLDRLWFPHFVRAIKPLVDAGVLLLWHCDGNLMQMVPRLIEAGIRGFQGFQYEDGMDYENICHMTDRAGGPLMIWAGVSVTRTLPHGTPQDVRDELKWLVANGPRIGLVLGCSSSMAPGVPRANTVALLEGLEYYRVHGRP